MQSAVETKSNSSKNNENEVQKTDSSYVYFQRIFKAMLFTILHSFLIHSRNLYYLIFGRPQKCISGQLALITGGGGGLGRAIALELAKNGCNVVIADVDLEAARNVANEVEMLNVKAKAFKVDVTIYTEVDKFINDVENDLGPIDILINNAGLLTRGKFLDVSPDEIESTIRVNLLSYILTTRKLLPSMIERKRGHIVAINSIAGLCAACFGSIYSATKHGVTGFMDSLSYELSFLKQDFIKTTTIFPYFILTRKDLIDYLNENEFLHYLPAFTPEHVAKRIVKGILQDQIRVTIPRFFKIILFLKRLSPIETDIFTNVLFMKKNL